MAIKLDMGSLLAEGVLGGIAGYAGEIGAEHKAARANDQAMALEKMKTDSAARIEAAKIAMAHPEHYTAPGVDENGKRTDNTYISKFKPSADGSTGVWEDTLMGSAPAKDDAAIAAGHDAAMGARSDAAAAASAARSDASAAASAARSDASASRSDARAAASVLAANVRDDAKAGREKTALDTRSTQQSNAATNAGMRQFLAASDQGPLLDLYNIDHNDPQATTKYKRFLQQSNDEAAGLAPRADSTVGQPPPPPAPPPTPWLPRAIMHTPLFGGAPDPSVVAPNAPAAESGSGWSAKPFAEGQVYTDAQGRKAKYQGGQWVPAQ
jgi:hypothetical protein